MGEVIRFPFERRDVWPEDYNDVFRREPAVIVVLPVVRIERNDDEPSHPVRI